MARGQRRVSGRASKAAAHPRNSQLTVEFNLAREPFGDPRVRKAIWLGINQPLTREIFSAVQALASTGWMPPGIGYNQSQDSILAQPGWRSTTAEDVEEAKRLLADAGYPDGIKDIDFICPNVGFASEFLCPAVQEQLARNLGVELNIRLVDRAQVGSEWQEGSFDMSYESMGFSIADPTVFWDTYLKTDGALNYWGYSDPEVDGLLAKLAVSTDKSARIELVRQVEALLDENPPWVSLGNNIHQPVWNSAVKGIPFDNLAFVDWGRVETAWLDR